MLGMIKITHVQLTDFYFMHITFSQSKIFKMPIVHFVTFRKESVLFART